MSAILATLVFAFAGTLSIAVMAATWRRHGEQVRALVRASRAVADLRDVTVTTFAPVPVGTVALPRTRKQVVRVSTRSTVRPQSAQRAAA